MHYSSARLQVSVLLQLRDRSRCIAASSLSIVVIDSALGELRRHSDRVLDRVRVRRSVGDEAYALHPQQRRAAVLRVVETLLEIGECAAREQMLPPGA